MSASLKKQGLELYDWYHYLWHLIAIRAIKVTSGAATPGEYEIEVDAWPTGPVPGTGETIAMIDTGVNDRHPNLEDRIITDDWVDFAAHPFGATFESAPATVPAPPNQLSVANSTQHIQRGLETPQTASLISGATWSWAATKLDAAENPLLEKLRGGRGVIHHTIHRSRQRYTSHGTACAGLMVGTPPLASATGIADAPSSFGSGDGPVPYWGVAPGAKLLPITVSAEPTAQQLIFALLYARDHSLSANGTVSVIHFPREASDPGLAHKYPKGVQENRYESDPDGLLAWQIFGKLFVAVSDEIPIVCAAGNDGYSHLIYPASKATDNNGIISVGALTYKARRSSYSNYCKEGSECSVTIAAPSNDAEMYTRHQVRLDNEAPHWRNHNNTVHTAQNPSIEVEYSPQALVTTDVPGPHGYADGMLTGLSTEEREDADSAALYAMFGGTSGASAIVAGAIALFQAKQRDATGDPDTGGEVKQKLKLSGDNTVSWPWFGGASVSIQTDTPNGESTVSFQRQFGAGVLNLGKLLS